MVAENGADKTAAKRTPPGSPVAAKRSRPEDVADAWSPDSWRQRAQVQMPRFPPAELEPVERRLRSLPPLVTLAEVRALRAGLREVYEGKRFLLQGGDCAESFADCEAGAIEKKLRILLQMSLVLGWVGGVPTLRVGRMAGQYAKPRSKDTEVVDGTEVPSFRGDIVHELDPARRQPSANRLLEAYFHSTATLNHVRTLLAGGLADLHQSAQWMLDYFNAKDKREKYRGILRHLLSTLQFFKVCGVRTAEDVRTVDFFTSHEGLLLPYESSLVREEAGTHFASSGHFLWIGDRTRQLDGAHVEFFRGLENPVGLKVGPSADPAEIVRVAQRLNPDNEPGKLVLITRMGAEKVRSHLPRVVDAVRAAGLRVIWQCDPMHGNTITVEGVKTRRFEAVLQELQETIKVHAEIGSRCGGVHFELTGEDVTECLGGPQNLDQSDLGKRYTTYCDPRLNYAQSMDMAFELATLLKGVEHADVPEAKACAMDKDA